MSTTTTAAPPAWLEAAAKLDALTEDKLPLAAENEPAEVNQDAESSAEESDPQADLVGVARPESAKGVAGSTTPFADSGRATQKSTRSHPRITPPVVLASKSAPAEEVELAWHGYSAAALVPSTIALAVVTLGTIVLLRPSVPTWVVHEAADAPLAALWLLQAIRAGYRLCGYNYRLTTRRLFRDRGRLYPREAPLDLATVVRAEVRQSLLGRLAGVGTVRVVPEDAAASVGAGWRPPAEGVGRPHRRSGDRSADE